MRGEIYKTAPADCEPVQLNSDLVGPDYNTPDPPYAPGLIENNPNGVAFPCGAIGKYIFSDKFALYPTSN